jgi:type II secretory pathway component PulM
VKQWFLGLTQREQLALMVMAAAIAVWLLLVVLLLPLERERERLADTNRATAEALRRVDELASALRVQRVEAARPASGRNLTALLNSSAEAAGLTINRLQPSSSGAVQLRFEAVSFAALLRWVYSLETGQGLLLEDVSISQAGAAGTVSATLRVSAAG